MNEIRVRKITTADFDPVTDLLVRAFDDDPWMNYVAKQDANRRSRMRAWLRRGLVKRTFPRGQTYVTTGGEGTALWFRPVNNQRAFWMNLSGVFPSLAFQEFVEFLKC